MTDTTNIVAGICTPADADDLVEVGDVARSDVPLDPDDVDTLPNIPRITDYMPDPRGSNDEPTPAA